MNRPGETKTKDGFTGQAGLVFPVRTAGKGYIRQERTSLIEAIVCVFD